MKSRLKGLVGLSLAILFVVVTSAGAQPLPTATPESQGFSSERLARLDATLKGLVDGGHLPGVSTMVIRHGKVVWTQVYGKADLSTGAPLKRDTIFRIYSQTKPVTGVALMILYEEGRFQLDDPVSKYIPEFAKLKVFKGVGPDGKFVTEDAARPPTMREIMTHTAGFAYGLQTDNPVDKAYREVLTGSPTQQIFIDKVAALPLLYPPGERWNYSIGVDLQGYVVERLSGMSLADFMQKRIFGPLNMRDTGFWLPGEKTPRLAALYMGDWEKRSNRPIPAEGFMVLDITKPPVAASGGGGLVSTLDDYARFAQMLANGGELDGVRILSPGTVKLMASNHLSDAILARDDGNGFNTSRGLGFGLDFAVVMDPVRAGTLAGKGTYSWGGAAGTWFWIDPENDVVFLGMIHVLARQADPALIQNEEMSQALVYSALVDPTK